VPIESSRFSPRNVGRAAIGLAVLTLGVWFLLVIALLHHAAHKLRTLDASKASPPLRTLQSEITAIQHLAHIESALERSAEHPSADSKPSSEKK
jgi:hypothetical protein